MWQPLLPGLGGPLLASLPDAPGTPPETAGVFRVVFLLVPFSASFQTDGLQPLDLDDLLPNYFPSKSQNENRVLHVQPESGGGREAGAGEVAGELLRPGGVLVRAQVQVSSPRPAGVCSQRLRHGRACEADTTFSQVQWEKT